MTDETANRNYKDGIFRSLFNNEEKILELYNAISGHNYPKGTPVKIVTLENAVFNGIKNDLAFIIDNHFIVLTEQQSTLSPNYPVRLFCYLADEYKKLAYSKLVYSKILVELPTPELYVFYNGKEDAPEEWEMKLSDAFKSNCGKISVEAVVKVINVNYDKGAEILQKCKTLQEYSMFVHFVNVRYEQTGDLYTAVRETVRDFIEKDMLADYLKEQRGNIMSVLEVNLTREECEEIRFQDGIVIGMERGRAEGKEEGIIEGEQKRSLEIARNLKREGIPIGIIAKSTGLSVEEIEKL